MKKVIIIIAGILVFAAAVFVCIGFFGRSADDSHTALLEITTKDQIKKYIEEKNIKSYTFDEIIGDEIAYIRNIELFGKTSDVELGMKNGAVTDIAVYYMVFPQIDTDIDEGDLHDHDEPDEEENYQEYIFTDEDKQSIEASFKTIKKGFEEYIGCSFDSYDLVPTRDMDTIEDTDENFYSGDVIREYSVRDTKGFLWLMRYEASYGTAVVTIHKLVRDTGYDGFIPSIDMTKK